MSAILGVHRVPQPDQLGAAGAPLRNCTGAIGAAAYRRPDKQLTVGERFWEALVIGLHRCNSGGSSSPGPWRGTPDLLLGGCGRSLQTDTSRGREIVACRPIAPVQLRGRISGGRADPADHGRLLFRRGDAGVAAHSFGLGTRAIAPVQLRGPPGPHALISTRRARTCGAPPRVVPGSTFR